MLAQADRDRILGEARQFFRDNIVENHKRNIEKLANLDEFDLNPFLLRYKAACLEGDVTALSVARSLVYPRALGTSINTSFGTQMQKFCTEVIADALGSTTTGMDLEFTDAVDNRKKYCQLKAGPNTINADDVDTIDRHFGKLKGLARTNNLQIASDQMIVGVVYGTSSNLSGHYRRIEDELHYPVFVGQDFWHRVTGDPHFYNSLIGELEDAATDDDIVLVLEETVGYLADDIRRRGLV